MLVNFLLVLFWRLFEPCCIFLVNWWYSHYPHEDLAGLPVERSYRFIGSKRLMSFSYPTNRIQVNYRNIRHKDGLTIRRQI